MKYFGHTRPVRDAAGNIIGQKLSPARAMTVQPLGPGFGSDRKHRLVVTLGPGDVISIRPEKTRRAVDILAPDLYRYVLTCIANQKQRERAAAAKMRKAELMERRDIARRERRLTRPD